MWEEKGEHGPGSIAMERGVADGKSPEKSSQWS